jgi:malate synthase
LVATSSSDSEARQAQPERSVEIVGPLSASAEEILTPDAVRFIATLQRAIATRRRLLLSNRAERQARIDAGERPAFLPETAAIRESDWTIARVPDDLQDRRVEITGPVDRKMIINALNSGASVFMADFEDATSPSWSNLIEGQRNLRDAVRRSITFDNPDGRRYELAEQTATLLVRPRGWHLPEKHVLVDGEPMSGSVFDFGLYLFHNAHELVARGSGPYYYLPKLQGHREARLWNELFMLAQDELGLPHGTIKATVLIEHILAAFEMDEILYELRDHAAGLNCGRWDYIFSSIKTFREDAGNVMPDRALVTMTTPAMRAYSLLAIQTCHRRNTHAIGGMAAQIPVRNNPAANEAAFAKVRADKEREASDGHDGTWVAHPGMVGIAKEAFDARMPGPNQIARKRDDVRVSAEDLLAVPDGEISEAGLRTNISVGIQYIASWLSGQGAAPIYNLMEDAATAEISRAQVWQWLRHAAKLSDGRAITSALFDQLLAEETDRLEESFSPERYAELRFPEALQLFVEVATQQPFIEFLTLSGYELLE